MTILFTDIEGSTHITESLGDLEWMNLLHDHNAIVRDQVARHSGFEVKSQGDGFMLAFPSAREALKCAIDIQRALGRRDSDDLRVRIGLHTGEPVRDADDFYGKAVNLAARIARNPNGSTEQGREGRQYSSCRRSHTWNAPPSFRPFGMRSRIP